MDVVREAAVPPLGSQVSYTGKEKRKREQENPANKWEKEYDGDRRGTICSARIESRADAQMCARRQEGWDENAAGENGLCTKTRI